MDILGLFVDNHDIPRHLYINKDQQAFKSALLFVLTARGIPFYYYGSEHAFNGGDDPWNRESMWQYLSDRESEIWKMTKKANEIRKAHKVWTHPMTERYVTQNFFAYTRGKLLVALTNDRKMVR